MSDELIKVTNEIKEQLELLKPERGLKNIKRFKNNYLWGLKNAKPKMHVSVGNLKLPLYILIFNLGTWFNCSGRKEKFCDICVECYDKPPEVRFKRRIIDRIEHEVWWRENPADIIAKEIILFIRNWNEHNKIKIKYIRFSEVGEIRNQKDLEKVVDVSNIVGEKLGIYSYIYTHNKKLDFNIDRPFLTINGSDFMVDNEFRIIKDDNFDLKEDYYECKCDCSICNKCIGKNNLVIIERLRR